MAKTPGQNFSDVSKAAEKATMSTTVSPTAAMHKNAAKLHSTAARVATSLGMHRAANHHAGQAENHREMAQPGNMPMGMLKRIQRRK